MEKIIDMEPLMEKLYTLAERGERQKMESLLDAVRLAYRQIKQTDKTDR